MAEALYNRDILRLAASLAGIVPVDAPDGVAECRSATCGSRVKASVRLDDRQAIAALALEVHACALGQAAAAIVQAEAEGASLEQMKARRDALAAFLAGGRDEPGDWPGMALLAPARDYPGRHAALLLPFDAVIAALETGRARD